MAKNSGRQCAVQDSSDADDPSDSEGSHVSSKDNEVSNSISSEQEVLQPRQPQERCEIENYLFSDDTMHFISYFDVVLPTGSIRAHTKPEDSAFSLCVNGRQSCRKTQYFREAGIVHVETLSVEHFNGHISS